MKVISIIGILDSGKSTVIQKLLEEVERRGSLAGVIVNDSGAVKLEDLAWRYPVEVIGGG
jgi:molybdopterin-guanine dinucleotide biosynthesis protein